jgi:hypothetical protein
MIHLSVTLYKPFHRLLNTKQKVICVRHQTFISGLTFPRESNQPFRLNAIVLMCSSKADIQTLNTVEGIPLLI